MVSLTVVDTVEHIHLNIHQQYISATYVGMCVHNRVIL